MADPVTALPEEVRELPPSPRLRVLRLLRRHDFRNDLLQVFPWIETAEFVLAIGGDVDVR